MFDLVEESLDQIAIPVDILVVGDDLRSGAGRRDHCLGADLRNAGAKAVGIITLVGEQLVERQPPDQRLGLEDVVHVARGQDETNGIAEPIDAHADLRARAAARTPDLLIFAPPFAPAACWCARTMVASMIKCSKSGSSTNALKYPPQPPSWPPHRSVVKPLSHFQTPPASPPLAPPPPPPQ